MTYFISLRWVGLVVGILYILTHLPVAWRPRELGEWISRFPRNYWAGVVLAVIAGLWATYLLAFTDLGEFSGYRTLFVIASVLGTLATIIYVPAFLSVRSMAILMLLSVAVILDAAFLVETPARLVMTCVAYVWAGVGMVLVCSPYLLRDAIGFIFQNPNRARAFAIPGVVLGAVILVLSFTAY